MERMMSVEEKIRRAEEIYNRKKENENNRQTARVSVESRPNKSILKKMRNQILVCVTIYFVFYFIINGNYTFSQSVKEKVNEVLEYDISLNTIYTSLCDLWNNMSSKINEISNGMNNIEEKNGQENIEINQENQSEVDNTTQSENEADTQNQNESIDELQTEGQSTDENTQTTDDNNSETSNSENIGGGTEEQLAEDNSISEEEQMQKDAEEIKSSISFIKPVSGTITSRFGWRNPTVSTVSKYHTGLDIGAVQGTEIKSATNGKVTLVSSEGDLRKSY